MLGFLKKHPFAVKAFFKKSVVLTFAIPKEDLQNLIPECVTLDVYDNKWAFVAIALVETKKLRPWFYPEFLGNNFTLIGYRVFVRYTNKKGKNLRGLYILKSETNKKKMEILGNIFTQYNYTTTDIDIAETENFTSIVSAQSKFDIEIFKNIENPALPKNSPFPDWKTARRFAGPLPFTFTYNKTTKEVIIIEGKRSNWVPIPIEIVKYNFNFLQQAVFKNAILANAFMVENIPYQWQKGKIELWK